MTPAQDPNSPLGKILRLTLDGKPAPGNPQAGTTGSATLDIINPPRDTELAKTAAVVSTYTFPGPNLTPSETWASGFRTPYGLAFAPDGRLWEVEHGPRGGDEFNLIRKGANYGWPVICYGMNYDGSPLNGGITAKEGMEQPLLHWTPSIAACGLACYTGDKFPNWKGNLLVGALRDEMLVRLELNGEKVVREERLLKGQVGRIRDVRVGLDGLVYLLTDERDGGVLRLDAVR
jgi:glucose/arabinose dehydrogenase